MAPKKPQVIEDEPSMSDIAKLLKAQGEQLANIAGQMCKIDKIERK
jgi:hypothetical protein